MEHHQVYLGQGSFNSHELHELVQEGLDATEITVHIREEQATIHQFCKRNELDGTNSSSAGKFKWCRNSLSSFSIDRSCERALSYQQTSKVVHRRRVGRILEYTLAYGEALELDKADATLAYRSKKPWSHTACYSAPSWLSQN